MILKTEKTIYEEFSSHENAIDQFRSDVLEGLTNTPKKLHSKYFYDTIGDRLFQQIMAMPEYYLTNCEMDIFQNKTSELAQIILESGTAFDLIELGAGDGTKSAFLLKDLLEKQADFNYMPIDISANILSVLSSKLKADLPELTITCLEGEYFKMLEKAANLSSRRKVVLFLGGNIGNMEKGEALAFCSDLSSYLSPGDIVLMGFDLKKNPQMILDAYNDKTGITAAFNLNLLTRINRELSADFCIEKFEHYQTYDPLSGSCRSYLISLADQVITIEERSVDFEKDELVYMELSQKYSLPEIEALAENSGFVTINHIMDSKSWFTDVAWGVV
ncbi:L-histidine N(alpha)-methyltransferase [Flavobacterium sp. ov086]|uniref:L-histidine N(alpha)-methyltransferase n=1 Tax=Flavobacterium sp. ov086 TaxID=1761785 RepID=UPI000B69F2EC|nr:L-histidine N(alpha)-methyltransferase [Flavobacterium sp. ov086]SNR76607.1 dimethylhistidine N-methyltransferase [Flavobacterium sp. ov086]